MLCASPLKGSVVLSLCGALTTALAQSPLEIAARGLPGETVAVIAVNEPGQLLNELVELLGADEEIAQALERELFGEALEVLGFDLRDAQACAKVGVDTFKPLSLAFLPLGRRGDFGGVLLGLGLSDRERLEEFLGEFVERHEDLVLTPFADADTLRLGEREGSDSVLLRFQDDRLLIGLSERRVRFDGPQLIYNALRPSLDQTEEFQAVLTGIDPGSRAQAFISLGAIARAVEDDDLPPLLREFSAIGISLSAQTGKAFAPLSADSPLRDWLKPGADSQDLVRHLQPSPMVVSVSVEKPLELMHYLIDQTEGARDAERFREEMSELSGLSWEDLGTLVSPGAVGGCAYPRGKGLVFIKLNGSAEQHEALLQNMRKEFGSEEAAPRVVEGRAKVYEGDWRSVGVIDGYLVLGDAQEQIWALAQQQAPTWEPPVGFLSGAQASVSPGEFVALLLGMEAPWGGLDGLATASVELGEAGLQLELGSDQRWAPLLSLLGLALGESARARQYEHREYAMYTLREVASAQTLFRENDQEGDSLFDYGDLEELVAADLIVTDAAGGDLGGYTLEVRYSRSDPEFLWAATATSKRPGMPHLFINQEGVVYARETPFELTDACEIPEDAYPIH